MLGDEGDVGEMVGYEQDPKNVGEHGDARDDQQVNHLKRSILKM